MKRFLILLSLSFTILVNNLYSQNFYNVDFTDLEVALEEPEKVKTLNLCYDGSVNWLIEHAAKFTALKELRLYRADLSNNSLPFGQLLNLEHLALIECGLSIVPTGILRLSKLKKLNLSQNNMMDLELLQDLDQLESLVLRFTPIDETKEYIGNWPNLKELYLVKNELTTFHNKILDLKNLEVLSWSGQKKDWDVDITIPKEIKKLHKLRRLYLYNLWLFELPKTIGSLHNLEVLDISRNFFHEFPKSMKRLKKLRKLDVNRVELNLEQLQIISKLRWLKELDLTGSLSIDEYISENSLRKKHSSSFSSSLLKEKEVLKFLKKLKRFKQLEYLNLTNNKIKNLPKYLQLRVEKGLELYY